MKTRRACELAAVMLLAWGALPGDALGAPPPVAGQGTAGTLKPTALITGTSRGIGLEFARQLAGQGWRVIATARDPAGSTELLALAAADPDVTLEPLDVTDHAAVDTLAAKYRGQGIDLLLLNAALGPGPATAMAPLAKVDFDDARASFETNALGPVKLCQAFIGHVAASGRKQIVAISSDSGSFVAGAQKPILYNYKASKAALNMYMHTLAFETPKRGVTLVLLHPGLVGTNPGLMHFPGALKTSDSVGQMLGVIHRLTPADNGRFLNYRGETMPW
jgi:NAD(P)-dependent dehydrogenase (short-subunit alcohol dehydrogenase family)